MRRETLYGFIGRRHGAAHLAEAICRAEFMRSTDMAVVVSQAQNEVADIADVGLDIAKHRKRMVTEDLDSKFKDPDDPFRLVFVCAMWLTGFDSPRHRRFMSTSRCATMC